MLKRIPWRKLDWRNTIFLVATHLAAIAGTALYVAFHGVTVAALAILAFFMFACGISVTGGYHRLFAHGTYKAHPLLRAFYLFFGAAALENSALKWSSDHRLHHAFVDEESDPYNIRKGFFWAHIGWVFIKEPADRRLERVGDLETDALVVLQHRFYVPIAIAAGVLLPMAMGLLLGDPVGAVVLGILARTVIIYHGTFCINSVAHSIGAQPYSDADSSRDSPITAVITMGEGYHNFHHTFPFDYRNGVRAHHLDPTKWIICGLSCTGLTRDLVRAPREMILKARLKMQERRATARFPVMQERLRAARERLEALLDLWTSLRARLANECSRETVRALVEQIAETRRRFREGYRAWRLGLRRPELLPASLS